MSDRLDPQFRDKLGNFEVPYNPADWASLQARMDAPARRRRGLLWVGLPAAAVLLGLSAFLFWPNQRSDNAGSSSVSSGVSSAASADGSGAASASGLTDGSSGGTSDGSAGEKASQATAQLRQQSAEGSALAGEAGPKVSSGNSFKDRPLVGKRAPATRPKYSSGANKTPATANDLRLGGSTNDALSRETPTEAISRQSLPDIVFVDALAREKYFPLPLDPMAAVSDPTKPADRELEKDPTLQRGRRLVDVALMGSVGLNAEYTAAGDGFRPGQDAGVGAELWFRSGVFLSAGLFYGQYHFHQNKVACGNPFNYGIKEPVHCPDALLGTQGRWEIPVQVGYGWELARARGRFRVAAGLTTQRIRQEEYDVEFHNAQPGVLLFYEPVTIAVTTSAAENLSFDAYGLVESTNQYTVQTVGPSERVLQNKINGAAELVLGYEQFLAPSFSLGIEPRIGMPFNKLPISEGRAYYGGVSARLRWYPGIGGR